MGCYQSGTDNHRYRLVGYRDRKPKEVVRSDEDGFCLMDAMMVCTRCSKVKEVGITHTLPAPIMPGGVNDVAHWNAYWSHRSPPMTFEPLEALNAIAGAVESLGFGPDHSVGIAVTREVRALRAYIRGMGR